MKIRKIAVAACVALTAAVAISSCASKQEGSTTSDKAAAETTEQAAAPAEEASAVTVLPKGQEIPAADGKLVIIDFNATWCGPCKKFAPNFEAVASRYADKAKFYSVDVDDHQELATKYNVQSIPMVVFIHPDGKVTSFNGYQDEAAFEALVNENLK